MSKEMIINVAEGEECRVAVVDQGRLEELYIERVSHDSHVGNIYKGKITNIEASIQAAFVDFGTGKNGFLHISDIHPRYFPDAKTSKTEALGKRKALKDRMPIQKCLKNGQEVIVQVTKESVKTKGPTLSTYLSFPGKYLVMMPWMKQSGISHKIEDEEERKRLRKILDEIDLPTDVGFIVRTAGQGCSKRDIQNDLKYLLRLWRSIENQIKTAKTPSEVYRESDLVIRTMRNIFNSDISKIICDCEEVSRRVKKFLSIATPRLRHRVSYYDGKVPLFHKYKIEDEITKIQSRQVELKGGGSIVIEQTEALVAIDVNSGKYRKQQSAEETAYNINLSAADEIARQLRLRDLGGLVICDFIDMREEKHRKAVEKQFRNATKADRARSKILKISQFGVVEMTRQRMRPSLQSSTYLECPTCVGKGFIKNNESISLEIIRLLNLTASNSKINNVELFVSHQVADYLQNERRAAISKIENDYSKKIAIRASASYSGENHNIVCYNDRGSVIKL